MGQIPDGIHKIAKLAGEVKTLQNFPVANTRLKALRRQHDALCKLIQEYGTMIRVRDLLSHIRI